MPGERLGVAWWLYPDEVHNADGRHIGYGAGRIVEPMLEPGRFDLMVEDLNELVTLMEC
jgi:hypothetical protein